MTKYMGSFFKTSNLQKMQTALNRKEMKSQQIHVCNDYLGVISMHTTKTEGLVAARKVLNEEPEIKELFVCDYLNRFDPVKLTRKK